MSSNNNQLNIPNAREAMDKFKMQAASEVGVNLKQGYNGDLTSREAGSVGGQMVKNICPITYRELHPSKPHRPGAFPERKLHSFPACLTIPSAVPLQKIGVCRTKNCHCETSAHTGSQ